MTSTKKSVTFVGIGTIGYVMARRLAHHGYAVAAVDPSVAARELAVAEGMTAYPDISMAPRTQISPPVPGGTSIPCSSRIRASTEATMGPQVPGYRMRSSPTAAQIDPLVSVRP